MALPVLKTNKYTTTIPSTGQKIEYRPFLVKEEKILLVAQQTEDQKEIIQAIKDVINACTFEKLDISKLTTYDIEYLFVKLRIKSVDQFATVMVKCPHCKEKTEIEIDLEKVEVVYPKEKIDPNIKLNNEGVGIKLKPLSLDDTSEISEDNQDFNKVIALCIESIYDSEKIYSKQEVTTQELNEFIDSFSRKNIQEIEKFITSQPSVEYSETHTCIHCGKTFEMKLSGLQDFFV